MGGAIVRNDGQTGAAPYTTTPQLSGNVCDYFGQPSITE
jgi:hypothetical protein